MNAIPAAALLLALLSPPPAPVVQPGACAFRSQPTVLVSERERLLQFWTEDDRPELSERTLPESPSLAEFRAGIAEAMDTDPRVLLANQLPHTRGADSANVRTVLDGRAGSLREMDCLEALLLSTQTERGARRGRPMLTHPTEFLGYVLRRGGKLKVYFYTVDQPGVRALGDLHARLEADLADGWTAVRNVHNHNFFPGTARVLGGVVPSGADVQYLRNAAEGFGLRGASITNGFHSLDVSRAEFDAFSGP